jgi:hypothetical protein
MVIKKYYWWIFLKIIENNLDFSLLIQDKCVYLYCGSEEQNRKREI